MLYEFHPYKCFEFELLYFFEVSEWYVPKMRQAMLINSNFIESAIVSLIKFTHLFLDIENKQICTFFHKSHTRAHAHNNRYYYSICRCNEINRMNTHIHTRLLFRLHWPSLMVHHWEFCPTIICFSIYLLLAMERDNSKCGRFYCWYWCRCFCYIN